MTVINDVAYGSDPLQKTDLYLPDQAQAPAVIFVHGGGWIRGDKQNDVAIGKYFAHRGYFVAIPNFRLAPAHQFPAAQDDLAAFCRWLLASPHDFDRRHIGLLGASAGGTMAITQSLATSWPTVAWSPIVDFATWVQRHPDIRPDVAAEGDRHDVNDAFYKYFIQAYLGDLSAAHLAAVNPMEHLTAKLGPTMLYNSTDELAPLTGALRFVERAAAHDSNIAIHVVPGTRHAMGYAAFALPGTAAFFDYYLHVAIH
ncbi:alpha/beta hydrolase [Lacticaseibacillus baoqingensis]|uniref:Alpha/beta hydrolase n=1 Tax=Lacticaseibacillus baoqingensis TaxID=2486013 RepID=A0ABW4E572_9LACO|nr:alpha/beta hydrolase [Lacticaseibacillus baoqingensis]